MNKEQIIELYKSGKRIKDIGANFGKTEGWMQRYFKREGIKARIRGHSSRKYNLDITFFDKIDNENKAYFLGLLYADGSNRDGRIRLVLQEKDKEILEKLSVLIYKENRPLLIKKSIYKYKGKEEIKINYELSMSSVDMAHKLTELGCMPNKSFKITFPEFLSKELRRHFIRGYFDGDGCISHGKNYSGFCLCGNKNFLEELQKIMVEECGLSFTKFTTDKKSPITKLEYHGAGNCRKIRDYLYTESNIFMKRKFDKFNTLK